MSWNVHHCRGADKKVDVRRVADRILAENPDFACLNEIKPPQALELGKKVKMFATPCGMRSCNANGSMISNVVTLGDLFAS